MVVDQTVLSPSSAGAAALGVDQIDTMADEPILASMANPIAQSISKILNDRLSQADLSADIEVTPIELQQMFAPLINPTPQPVSSPSELLMPQPEARAEPAPQIPTNLPSLSAVMPSKSGHSGAILNGTLYRIGDSTPDGYRLISVQQRRVLVGYKGQEYWLSLPVINQ